MAKTKQLKKWAKTLTKKQMEVLLVELVEFAIESEVAAIGDMAPFWNATGEPLIEGQETYKED